MAPSDQVRGRASREARPRVPDTGPHSKDLLCDLCVLGDLCVESFLATIPRSDACGRD
jgi:hypothetical protein